MRDSSSIFCNCTRTRQWDAKEDRMTQENKCLLNKGL